MVYQIIVHNPFEADEGDSYFPFLIRLKTGKHFNHTGLLYYDEKDKCWYFAHAIAEGVTRVLFEEWLVAAPNRSTITVPLDTELPWEKVIENIKAQLKKPYNKKGILQNLLYKTFGIWIGEKDDYSSEYCYEFVRLCAGDKNAYKASPLYKKS